MKKFAILAPLTLTLAGCFNPHVMNDQDAAYCESHGFTRGSDAHADCAAKRDEERAQGGGK